MLACVLCNSETLIENAFNEIFSSTSSGALSRWERMLNIPTAENVPDNQRQSRILGKLRGTGTCTSELLKSVAETYSNGECEIIENPSLYKFCVKFIGALGVPPNLQDLKNTIDDIKPAHLIVEYVFTYLTWDSLESYNKTFDSWDSLNLTWDKFETYKE